LSGTWLLRICTSQLALGTFKIRMALGFCVYLHKVMKFIDLLLSQLALGGFLRIFAQNNEIY